jgi:hypothetical protein
VVPRVSVTVGGDVTPWFNVYRVRPGGRIVLTSNIPVNWMSGFGLDTASAQVISSSPTRWEATLTGPAFGTVGISAGQAQPRGYFDWISGGNANLTLLTFQIAGP